MNNNDHFSLRKATISQYLTISPIRLSLLLVPALLVCNAFGQTLTTLYNFGAVPGDGLAPASGVVIDRNGNLFGTTGVGGAQVSDGTVFELSPPTAVGNSWTETVLHRFRGTPDGKNPLSRLVMTSNGALFGTTSHGGIDDSGTAYTVSPGQGRETILHDFGTIPNDVVSPTLGFLVAPEGLYGVDQGSANNTGAVYLLTPPTAGGSWTQNILYSFQAFQSGDAASPSSELVRDSSGNFYGVTAQGGVNNLGALYEVSPPKVQGNSWTETVLFSFNGTNGTIPAGRLLLGRRGQLFGTTDGGGSSGAGTVFELDPPTVPGNPWIHKILHAFSGGADGTSPENGVIADRMGRLVGTAGETIFMLTPPTSGSVWKETVLHTFSGPDGFAAATPLTLFNNALYGTTSEAGAFGSGTVFQLTLP